MEKEREERERERDALHLIRLIRLRMSRSMMFFCLASALEFTEHVFEQARLNLQSISDASKLLAVPGLEQNVQDALSQLAGLSQMWTRIKKEGAADEPMFDFFDALSHFFTLTQQHADNLRPDVMAHMIKAEVEEEEEDATRFKEQQQQQQQHSEHLTSSQPIKAQAEKDIDGFNTGNCSRLDMNNVKHV